MSSQEQPPEDSVATSDNVMRAITDDDNFRVMVANTSDTVRQAIGAQEVSGATADHFANLLSGTVLIRETMSPQHRVQAILRGAGGAGRLIADAHPDGMTRGLVQIPEGADTVTLGAGQTLQMMRAMARGKMHRSVVQPPADGGIAEALMTYMQESEQIVSMIGVAVYRQDDAIVHAGGYVVQLLPGAERGPLMLMTQRLTDMPPLAEMLHKTSGSTQALLDELLYGIPYAQLDKTPVRFGCRCSQQAVVATLASLSRDDVAEIIREQDVVELSCDYCRTDYQIRSTQLTGLLASS